MQASFYPPYVRTYCSSAAVLATAKERQLASSTPFGWCDTREGALIVLAEKKDQWRVTEGWWPSWVDTQGKHNYVEIKSVHQLQQDTFFPNIF